MKTHLPPPPKKYKNMFYAPKIQIINLFKLIIQFVLETDYLTQFARQIHGQNNMTGTMKIKIIPDSILRIKYQTS